MKSLKKTLVLLVAISMILTTLVPAFAATDVKDLDCEDAVLRMEALEIIKGYEDGTFKPENTITRAEMAVIICKMVGISEATAEASKNVDSKFSDVKAGSWYTGWVNLAAGTGIINGFPDGTFRPDEKLTLNQVLTLCVNALGRGVYVAQEGTWPANYVTEAARLGLLDDVEGSEANRGNVAIIAWNTLGAKVWGVDSTKGTEVTKGQVSDTLLATHFRNFVYETKNAADDKWFKEAEELTVVAVPSTDKEIGDRQIVLTGIPAEIQGAFEKAPRKDEDEATYRTLDADDDFDKVYAYVPEEVYDDIDNLLGREITVMFGKNNIVALIIVTNDDVVNNEYATKYDDGEITIAGEKYKFDTKAEVYVNNVRLTSATVTTDEYDTVFTTGSTGILAKLGEEEGKTFNKNVRANVVLNTKGKITRLDLYVSGNLDAYLTREVVVGKVRSEKIYANNETTLVYNYKDVDEEDLPRVYVDGKKAAIEDIVVGNVLTIYYTAGHVGSADYVDTIYASTKTVTGEITRAKDKVKVTIDGEVYVPSSARPLVTEDELKDASAVETLVKYVDEEATLYVNIYGEYVLASADEVQTDYQFAILDYVYDVKEDEEDEDVYTQKLRLFMPDGTKSREFVVTYDKSDFDGTDEDEDQGYVADPDDTLIPDTWVKGNLIAFSADANKEIKTEDIANVTLEEVINETGSAAAYAGVEGYDLIAAKKTSSTPSEVATANYDDQRITVDGTAYRFKSSAIILNANSGDPEVGSWKKLVDADDNAISAANLLIITDEDSTTISYIYIDSSASATSSTRFAVVTETGYTGKLDGKTVEMVRLFTEDGEEEEFGINDKTVAENTVVGFKTSNDKLSENPTVYVDVDELNDLELDATMTDAIMTGKAISAADGKAAATKEAYRIDEVDGKYLTYVKLDDVVRVADVKVDLDEVVVIDIRNNTPTVVDFAEIEAGDLVAAFENGTDGYTLLVIFAD